MKKFSLLTLLFFVIISNLFSQDIVYSNKYTVNSQYIFSKFITGKIKFTDGCEMNANLNFNVLSEEIQYIENDTIKKLMNKEIRYVTLDTIKFIYFNSKYYQLAYQSDGFKLIFKYNPDLESIDANTGGYGTSTETTATNKMRYSNQKLFNDRVMNIENDDSQEVKIHPTYYLLKNNKNIIKITKKKIYKLSKKSKTEIDKYIKTHKINLNNRDDLIELLKYI